MKLAKDDLIAALRLRYDYYSAQTVFDVARERAGLADQPSYELPHVVAFRSALATVGDRVEKVQARLDALLEGSGSTPAAPPPAAAAPAPAPAASPAAVPSAKDGGKDGKDIKDGKDGSKDKPAAKDAVAAKDADAGASGATVGGNVGGKGKSKRSDSKSEAAGE